VRYFAEGAVSLKGLAAALKAIDPQFKIDGGELMQGPQILAEVEIDNAGSDLFNEEIATKVGGLEHVPSPTAQHVIARLRGTQSIVAVKIDPNIAWELLNPLWSVLPNLSTGITHVDGQGFYDGGQLIVNLA